MLGQGSRCTSPMPDTVGPRRGSSVSMRTALMPPRSTAEASKGGGLGSRLVAHVDLSKHGGSSVDCTVRPDLAVGFFFFLPTLLPGLAAGFLFSSSLLLSSLLSSMATC